MSGRWELLGWSCRNGMGRGYGGGARFERSLRVTGAGAAEMAWEEATGERGLSGRCELLGLELQKWHGKRLSEGERGLSGRWELLGLELQKWHGKRLRRGSEV